MNMTNKMTKTRLSVVICEEKSDWSILLYKTIRFVSLKVTTLGSSIVVKSVAIFCKSSFLRKPLFESLMRVEKRN
jgi:regulation of enolase protein 1 (concanavalin A-like superfamily)